MDSGSHIADSGFPKGTWGARAKLGTQGKISMWGTRGAILGTQGAI